ncbi:protein FAM83B [Pleurodeles waltl]|uniref:protein FAM83B n=1 Tax=Pleurodeles waltl TaxID=8319 RepID=UPI0037095A14
MPSMMDSLSALSSLHEESRSENYIEPHYKEWYRVAIETLIEGGVEAYQEFITKERVTEFLAEEELSYILNNIKKPPENVAYSTDDNTDDASSSGTYWPMESDVEAPNLDLGWPNLISGLSGPTKVDLLFHPPRAQPLTIKETVRKMMKDAKQVIAIVMDMFTDVDLFKEVIEASTRGISVYILLDDTKMCHFLKMTEKQGFQVQRNRNIRVRTVKGHDYFSKSGAKFCGRMEQKFLLVDSKKVLYGNYSFMWSFEKVHLSMVQVITGQLVESFDEEFRTLYARSCVPSGFGPEELGFGKNRKMSLENGIYQHSLTSLASSSSQQSLFGRHHKMHTLDTSFLKSHGRYAINEDERYSLRNATYRPHLNSGYNVQQKIQQLQQAARNENWKRHSYAGGEKPESSPYLMLNRGVNHTPMPSHHWKTHLDNPSVGSSSRGGYIGTYNGSTQGFVSRFAQPNGPYLAEKPSTIRRSFHGTDNHIRTLQQKMPTLERTTKSFLRNWRIESYLNDQSDFSAGSNAESIGDRHDTSDGTENPPSSSIYTHSRLRSSLVFKPTLPEQKEAISCTSNSTNSNSTIIDSQESVTPKPIRSNESAHSRLTSDTCFTGYATHQQLPEADKRRSLHIPEGSRGDNYTTNKPTTSYLYTSLCANKQGDNIASQQNDTLLKRRSLPMFESLKLNIANSVNRPSNSYIYSSLVKGRVREADNPAVQPDNQQLNSVHAASTQSANVDERNTNESRNDSANKALSYDSLNESCKDETNKQWSPKKENKGSPNFLKKGSKKLKSLLSLTPDKKETLSKSKAPAFYRMCSSSDTLISEEDDVAEKLKKSENKTEASPNLDRLPSTPLQSSLYRSKESVCVSPARSVRSVFDEGSKLSSTAGPIEGKFSETTGDASAPRFNTEQIQYQDPKETRMEVGYGTAYVSTSLQRVRPQRDMLQREIPQRDMLPREIPQRDMVHREVPPRVHLQRALSHRDILQRDIPARDMVQREMSQRDTGHRVIPQRELSHREVRNHEITPCISRMSDRRLYSRFEPFYKAEGSVQSTNTTENTNTPVMEHKSNAMGHSYTRQSPMMNYSSPAFQTYHANENKFGRFMQKFGNLIHKNK